MKKKDIIKESKEFTEIIKKCPFIKNNYFIIYYRKNNKSNRYGISIPTKIGKAHIRNKIKRRIKNIIDLNKKIMHNSYDYVIISRKRILELDYQEMNSSLINLMKKIGDSNETK